MSGKKMSLVAVCSILLIGATAQAVVVDLSSSQAGTTLVPGETVDLTLTVTNDTAANDVVYVQLSMTIQVGEQTFTLDKAKPFRLKLGPEESFTKTVEVTIPNLGFDLLAQPVSITITATAEGRTSETTATDSVDFTLDI